jgi:rare lipoprotein A
MIKIIHITVTALLLFCSFLSTPVFVHAQNGKEKDKEKETSTKKKNVTRILYGQASFYANKFEGRKTATGEKFSHDKMTAACNVLPLGTWIRITNLKNGKSIEVRTNDRLHPKTRRIVDLTKKGAHKLGYYKSGLTRVKVEVLKHKP